MNQPVAFFDNILTGFVLSDHVQSIFGYIKEHSLITILNYGYIIKVVCFIKVRIERNTSWFCIFPCEILMAC